MSIPAQGSGGSWKVPECPFEIEYSARVVDDIRLAVVDAFFSLQRGGVEIGGILLGNFANGRLVISGSAAFDCEHASGPSFVLSARDRVKLQEQLSSLQGGPARPVGWYHSHTRSGIFLSEQDLEIHRQFFPEPHQVALVLHPHSIQPVRAGFFFRAADGSIHATATYREFQLDPLPVQPYRPQPVQMPPPPPEPAPQPKRTSPVPLPDLRPVDVQPIREAPPAVVQMPLPAAAEAPPVRPAEPPAVVRMPEPRVVPIPLAPAAPAPDPEPPPPALPVKLPGFLAAEEAAQPERRNWTPIVLLLIAGAAIGAGYQTRQRWLPQVAGLFRMDPAPSALGLKTAENIPGQIEVQWDRTSPALRNASEGNITVVDGTGAPQTKKLDAALLQSGRFGYTRRSPQVDFVLTIRRRDGIEVHEKVAFMGQPLVPQVQRERQDAENARKQQELVDRASKLQNEVNKQAARTKQLEKSMEDMRMEMQKKRMENQIPDPDKK